MYYYDKPGFWFYRNDGTMFDCYECPIEYSRQNYFNDTCYKCPIGTFPGGPAYQQGYRTPPACYYNNQCNRCPVGSTFLRYSKSGGFLCTKGGASFYSPRYEQNKKWRNCKATIPRIDVPTPVNQRIYRWQDGYYIPQY